jgi:hypothetical protein
MVGLAPGRPPTGQRSGGPIQRYPVARLCATAVGKSGRHLSPTGLTASFISHRIESVEDAASSPRPTAEAHRRAAR